MSLRVTRLPASHPPGCGLVQPADAAELCSRLLVNSCLACWRPGCVPSAVVWLLLNPPCHAEQGGLPEMMSVHTVMLTRRGSAYCATDIYHDIQRN